MIEGAYRRHYLAYEAQHKLLLNEFDWSAPSDAIQGLLAFHGYEIAARPLPRGRLAEVDYRSKVVAIDPDFRGRLETPQRAREVLMSTLAHELAHIVLHEGVTRFQRRHEAEAWCWAIMLLCPWWILCKTPEVKAIESGHLSDRHRWAHIYSLAKSLKVSPSMVNQAIKLYGIGASNAPARAA